MCKLLIVEQRLSIARWQTRGHQKAQYSIQWIYWKGTLPTLSGLGFLVASLQSVKAFDKMFLLAAETSKVREELQWLSRILSPQTHVWSEMSLTIPGHICSATGTIFNYGREWLHYTTLACERYVKRFTIDNVFEFCCKGQARRHCVPALLQPYLG